MAQFKKILNQIKPEAERIFLNTTRGYLFGCVFGAFVPSKKPLLKSMEENGKNFAQMSAAYSVTEISLEKLRKKNDLYNSIVSGVVAGAVGSFHGSLSGGVILGTYSGLTRYFTTKC